MIIRERLPNRRACESFEFRHAGLDFTLCAGSYPDGRIAGAGLIRPLTISKPATGLCKSGPLCPFFLERRLLFLRLRLGLFDPVTKRAAFDESSHCTSHKGN